MDVVLHFADEHILDKAWSSIKPDWDRDNIIRQCVSLYALTIIGIFILYFGIAGASYKFIFDKRMMKHPRFLKNQVRQEIKMSLNGFWVLDFLTLPWFLGECRGFSKMYEGIENSPFGGYWGGIAYIVLSSAFFLWFTDLLIYFVHRWLHWPAVYKRLHKPHHKWVIPTPFASHAFNPFDGYLQSIPYHLFVYLFPLHKYTYLGLFVVVNLWSIFIHDSDMIVGHPLENIINGPAHHTLHHMYFVYNYGQYFTWADKVGGSYRHPATEDDPLNLILEKEAARIKYLQEKEEMKKLAEAEEASKNSNVSSASSSNKIDASSRGTMQRLHSTASATAPESELMAVSSSSNLMSGRTTPDSSSSSSNRSDSGFESSEHSDKDDDDNSKSSLRRRK